MRAADDADFSLFVEASSRRLLRSAYLMTGELAEAEDVLQTALERAYRRPPCTGVFTRGRRGGPYPDPAPRPPGYGLGSTGRTRLGQRVVIAVPLGHRVS